MAIKLHYKIRHKPFVSPRRQLSMIKLVVVMLIISITGSGCAFSQYKLAKKDIPPPIEMDLSLSQLPIEVLLNSVIIYKGPGSWKREAYWDEYIVSIANLGRLPLSIKSATLIDFQDNYNIAGSDPWKLEKQSKAWWKKTQASGTGITIVLGGGTAVSALALASAVGTMSTGSAVIGVIGAAGVVILPVVGVSYIVGNIRGRSKIEKEFNRRRLVLPVTIPVAQVVQGSLFFPISPGPKCLILNYQMSNEVNNMEFELSPLKTLHIKEEEDKLPDSSFQKSVRKN